MSDSMPTGLRALAARQEGVITRKQALAQGMAAGAITWKLRSGRWQQLYQGVYATFTGALSRRAQLLAALLYAGRGAVLSHESAGELQGLVDQPASVIHVTVPASRRVKPAPGLVVHVSNQPARLTSYPRGGLPMTLPEDTVIDLAESADTVDDVYGWVTKAYGRKVVSGETLMFYTAKQRRMLRWRAELNEAIMAGARGAHSALELRWDRDVEQAHGLPAARKQVRFIKKNGQRGFRDRVYPEWGVIIELDGRKAHPDEQQGEDQARDRDAAEQGEETLRYGWRETRYEACECAVQVAKVLWRRGWRGRPEPCSLSCPVAQLLADLDQWLATLPDQQRRAWERIPRMAESGQRGARGAKLGW